LISAVILRSIETWCLPPVCREKAEAGERPWSHEPPGKIMKEILGKQLGL